jgi:hypothetical protein
MNLASVITRWLLDDRPAWEIIEQFEQAIADALTQPEAYPNGMGTDAPGGYTVPTWITAEFERIHKERQFLTVNEQRESANMS